MRVCFIGNSHLAAIKLGWDAIKLDYPDLHLSFFGALGDWMDFIHVDGDVIKSADDRLTKKLNELWGTAELRTADYDLLCIHGMGAGLRAPLGLYRSFRSDEHQNREGQFRRLSPECFDRALGGLVRGTLAARTAERIRSATNLPLMLVEQPALVESAWRGPAGEWLAPALATRDGEALVARFHDHLTRIPGVTELVAQPPETKANVLCTKDEFSLGSVKLKGGVDEVHENDDYAHMNAAYGSVVLKQIAHRLSTTEAP